MEIFYSSNKIVLLNNLSSENTNLSTIRIAFYIKMTANLMRIFKIESLIIKYKEINQSYEFYKKSSPSDNFKLKYQKFLFLNDW